MLSQIKDAAQTEMERGMAVLESKAQDQLRLLDHLGKRLSMLEMHKKAMATVAAGGGVRYANDTLLGLGKGGDQQRYIAAVRGAEKELNSLR